MYMHKYIHILTYMLYGYTAGVGGLKTISRIDVAIVFLETIYHKNKETAKKKVIIAFSTVCRAKFGELTKFGSKN